MEKTRKIQRIIIFSVSVVVLGIALILIFVSGSEETAGQSGSDSQSKVLLDQYEVWVDSGCEGETVVDTQLLTIFGEIPENELNQEDIDRFIELSGRAADCE